MARRKMNYRGESSLWIEDSDNFTNIGMVDHPFGCLCELHDALRITVRQRPHEACFDGDYDGRNQ